MNSQLYTVPILLQYVNFTLYYFTQLSEHTIVEGTDMIYQK